MTALSVAWVAAMRDAFVHNDDHVDTSSTMAVASSSRNISEVTIRLPTKAEVLSTADRNANQRPRDPLHSSSCSLSWINSVADGAGVPPNDDVLQREGFSASLFMANR